MLGRTSMQCMIVMERFVRCRAYYTNDGHHLHGVRGSIDEYVLLRGVAPPAVVDAHLAVLARRLAVGRAGQTHIRTYITYTHKHEYTLSLSHSHKRAPHNIYANTHTNTTHKHTHTAASTACTCVVVIQHVRVMSWEERTHALHKLKYTYVTACVTVLEIVRACKRQPTHMRVRSENACSTMRCCSWCNVLYQGSDPDQVSCRTCLHTYTYNNAYYHYQACWNGSTERANTYNTACMYYTYLAHTLCTVLHWRCSTRYPEDT